jgi:alpha-beta hydrolase superfamily lysophospholipase
MITVQSPPQDVAIISGNGKPLRGWYWTRPAPRGVLVIAHGFGEHGACYRHVAEALAPALELEVLAADQRGHGRSPGRRGVVRRYEDLLLDVDAAFALARRQRPGLPVFLLGHSNGGLLALLLALRGAAGGTGGDGVPAGLILSNPALRIVAPVSPLKLMIGRFLLHCAPGVTLSGKLDPALMTRDPEMQREHETDPLRHSRMSSPLFFGMTDSGALAASNAAALLVPVLMLLGGSDPVIDAATSRAVFERLGSTDKTLRIYPSMLHEPLNEIDREQVFADIEAWLKPRLEGKTGSN